MQVLDAIVGDPPYGVRAGGRKSKRNPDARIMNRATYIPSTAPYTLTECLGDLLEFAAVLLVVGELLFAATVAAPSAASASLKLRL